jgi:hypothetical protein
VTEIEAFPLNPLFVMAVRSLVSIGADVRDGEGGVFVIRVIVGLSEAGLYNAAATGMLMFRIISAVSKTAVTFIVIVYRMSFYILKVCWCSIMNFSCST